MRFIEMRFVCYRYVFVRHNDTFCKARLACGTGVSSNFSHTDDAACQGRYLGEHDQMVLTDLVWIWRLLGTKSITLLHQNPAANQGLWGQQTLSQTLFKHIANILILLSLDSSRHAQLTKHSNSFNPTRKITPNKLYLSSN